MDFSRGGKVAPAPSNSARNPQIIAYDPTVKKLIALIFAFASGLYVFTGWIPDPLPFLDEATALVIFVKSMGVLGIDLSRFVPFMSKRVKTAPKPGGQVVDV